MIQREPVKVNDTIVPAILRVGLGWPQVAMHNPFVGAEGFDPFFSSLLVKIHEEAGKRPSL